MAKRPKSFRVGRVLVRARRGPREDGRWYWRADRPVGRSQREDVWLGWGTRDEAEAQVIAALTDPTVQARREEGQPELQTVFDLLDCWLAAQRRRNDIADSTKEAGYSAVKRLIAADISRVRLEHLGRGAVERHRDAELRRGAAGSTVLRDIKVLRQAWRWAREIGHAPNRELPLVAVHRRDPVYSRYTPSRKEIGQLLTRARRPWLRRSILLLSATGARIGEIAHLCWAQVAADGTVLTLEGKTGVRQVPLHPTVAAEVGRWERGRPDDTVLGVTPKSATTRTQEELAWLSAELGIPRVSPNGLRRAMTDALYRAGVGVDVEAALLGHSPATALSHYRQVADDDRLDAVIRAGVGLPPLEGDTEEDSE